jgi:hypothetical protein
MPACSAGLPGSTRSITEQPAAVEVTVTLRGTQHQFVGAAALVAHLQARPFATDQRVHQRERGRFPGGGFTALHGGDLVTGTQPGLCDHRTGLDLADHRAQTLDAGDEQQPVGEHREHQVEGRPGRDDRSAHRKPLAVEGAWQVRHGHLALALVDELDVATEGNRGDDVLGLVDPGAA